MNRREAMLAGVGVVGATGAAGLLGTGASVPASASADEKKSAPAGDVPAAPHPKLGLISYNLGAKWDLPTMLKVCKTVGIDAVEFRTTHGHGVEPSLSPEARAEVKKKCADAGVKPYSLGSVCEFHATDPAVVKKNIDDCAAFVKLAADIGARGVKVRPNGLPKGVEPAKTLEQIGKSLVECGKIAADAGVEIWLEVHGKDTCLPANCRAIMDHCGHAAVGLCWNSNGEDVRNGSVAESFELLKKDIKHCHINELVSGYPYRELFAKLRSIQYDRYTMIEVGQAVAEDAKSESPVQAIRFLKYYKALWTELMHG
jgi:sugar phosphate isomerase/epimerase